MEIENRSYLTLCIMGQFLYSTFVVLTFFQNYQQMTKVAASKERVHFCKVYFGTYYMLTIIFSVISVRWVGVGQARDSIIELF